MEQDYPFLPVVDIFNPNPVIVKLWESQIDMDFFFFFLMGADLTR